MAGSRIFRVERIIGDEDGTRHCHSHIGDIVLGRVQRVMAGMQAAFVDVGLERAGFLGLREARMLARSALRGHRRFPIACAKAMQSWCR